jgi:Zn-dependent peptidase ImmA (M78 family)
MLNNVTMSLSSPNDVPLWWLMRRSRATADYILNAAGIRQPPVDIRALAQAMDIEVREAEMQDTGTVEASREGAIITVRASDSNHRKRFTIAHEIGHIMKHELGIQYRDKAFNETHLENEANAFGADLLMPMWMLDAYVMGLTTDHKRLAKLFDVSDVAMRLRLVRWSGRRK